MMNFESLGLSPEILRAIKDMSFETPSPIQAQAIPLLLQKLDIIGQAQTGTGKTAAFAIPMIEGLDSTDKRIQGVVLCPTRELAMQVADEFRKLTKYKPGMTAVSIYGGQPIDRQLKALRKRPQILVATPGRMLDHLRRGSFRLEGVKTVILDEADEMLDMGFREDIESILNQTPQGRQTVLFSATMPKAILELTKRYQQNPQHIQIASEPFTEPQIQQEYIETSSKSKLGFLTRLIEVHQLKRALVFCNTKRQVDQLAEALQEQGYPAEALHGGLSQNKRTSVMGRFRKGAVHVLVATDVAARGIDVQNVQAVFNFDVPESHENYLHRIGRTGRAGNTGLAFTFGSANQLQSLKGSPQSIGEKPASHKPRKGPSSKSSKPFKFKPRDPKARSADKSRQNGRKHAKAV